MLRPVHSLLFVVAVLAVAVCPAAAFAQEHPPADVRTRVVAPRVETSPGVAEKEKEDSTFAVVYERLQATQHGEAPGRNPPVTWVGQEPPKAIHTYSEEIRP